MTKPYDEWRKKSECSNDETDCTRVFCQSDFVIPSSFKRSSFVIILRTLTRRQRWLSSIGGTQAGRHFRSLFGMINPNENNLSRDEPLPPPVQRGEQQIARG